MSPPTALCHAGDAAYHPVRRSVWLRLGAGAGFVFGTVTYLIGNKFSIDWTTIICDYFLAFTALGFGAGLLARRKWSVFYGTVIGGVLRFLATISSARGVGQVYAR